MPGMFLARPMGNNIMSLGRMGTDLAIDLGTANTCVFARGRGVVINEPSLIAFNTTNGAVEAVGAGAREMLGRTPAHVRPVRPIKDGVIADFEAAEKMMTHFIQKAHKHLGAWMRPRVVIGVPTEITPVERRAVKDSAYRAKASSVHLVDEPMAAAVGAGLPIADDSILDRAPDVDVPACRLKTFARSGTNGFDGPISGVEGDERGFVDDDAASTGEDAGVGGAEIDGEVGSHAAQ